MWFNVSFHELLVCSLSRSLTCHGDLALRPADGSAGSAESQQHGRLCGLSPPSAFLSTDDRLFEQSGGSQAARGVCSRPLRTRVRLNGGLRAL